MVKTLVEVHLDRSFEFFDSYLERFSQPWSAETKIYVVPTVWMEDTFKVMLSKENSKVKIISAMANYGIWWDERQHAKQLEDIVDLISRSLVKLKRNGAGDGKLRRIIRASPDTDFENRLSYGKHPAYMTKQNIGWFSRWSDAIGMDREFYARYCVARAVANCEALTPWHPHAEPYIKVFDQMVEEKLNGLNGGLKDGS